MIEFKSIEELRKIKENRNKKTKPLYHINDVLNPTNIFVKKVFDKNNEGYFSSNELDHFAKDLNTLTKAILHSDYKSWIFIHHSEFNVPMYYDLSSFCKIHNLNNLDLEIAKTKRRYNRNSSTMLWINSDSKDAFENLYKEQIIQKLQNNYANIAIIENTNETFYENKAIPVPTQDL